MAKKEKTQDKDSKTAQSGEKAETQFGFQAEVARLLQLMVHSVYSEKDIFLRELISNSADACDKLRYAAITKPELLADEPDLRITLSVDEDAKTLSISDNGIGMGRAELIDNLGTIARSGTRAFLKVAEKKGGDAPSVIGQFGVGFYSAFMVANRVDVLSRKAGAKSAHVWTSDGVNGFNVSKATKAQEEEVPRGTVVTLHMKDDALDYLKESELARIVRAYSDHIPFHIDFLATVESKEEPHQLNSASALWTRPKADVTADQYKELYHHVGGLFDEPALTIHYRAEGRHEYTVLLFVPTMAPFDLYDPSRAGRVRLYVRRVFITDDADLLPAYLRFVRGIVDSEDVPLNISREMLQNNPIVAAIRTGVTNRVLSELEKLAKDDTEKFESFWETFGAVVKEGLYEDMERRDALFELARFRSSHGDGWRTLKAYIADLRPNQTAIYYMTGNSQEQIAASPQLEGFAARGVEVLYLSDPVDNFWVTTTLGFEGKPFQSITQGDIDLSAIPLPEDKGEESERKDASDPDTVKLVEKLKSLFADELTDVRASARLVESPACLVAPAEGPDRGLDKFLEKQAGQGGAKPVLEINPSHDLVKALSKSKADAFDDIAWLLLDQARILEGTLPENPGKFAERLNRLVLDGQK
ncbi:MAG: molecular chaperone HtpG [Hyphomicrobiaceae bacterium]|nr:molecular chaperone HtpG [Hyphomicrobiaceae bacterium]